MRQDFQKNDLKNIFEGFFYYYFFKGLFYYYYYFLLLLKHSRLMC